MPGHINHNFDQNEWPRLRPGNVAEAHKTKLGFKWSRPVLLVGRKHTLHREEGGRCVDLM